MFPEPRITDAKVFMSQTPIDPVNATFEYAIACASASSRPPSAAYMAGPKTSISTVYSAPADNPILPPQVLASIYHGMGINLDTTMMPGPGERPIRLVEAEPIRQLFS